MDVGVGCMGAGWFMGSERVGYAYLGTIEFACLGLYGRVEWWSRLSICFASQGELVLEDLYVLLCPLMWGLASGALV